jgi:hypothetical protein
MAKDLAARIDVVPLRGQRLGFRREYVAKFDEEGQQRSVRLTYKSQLCTSRLSKCQNAVCLVASRPWILDSARLTR